MSSNEPAIPEILGRLTPSTKGFDRDEWLFQAGRASAPRHRGWQVATVVLALTQVVTLALWWNSRGNEVAPPTKAPEPTPERPIESTPPSYPPGSYGELMHSTSLDKLPEVITPATSTVKTPSQMWTVRSHRQLIEY